MLSHRNLAWTSHTLLDIGRPTRRRRARCRTCRCRTSPSRCARCTCRRPTGASVYFAESIEKVPENLKDARPTVFFGVPRIWEKFHAVLAGKLAEATGAKKQLVAWARKVCTRGQRASAIAASRCRRALELQYRLADRLVISKIKQALGFDRARELISGAAPIAPDVLEFFSSLDLPIREIYGQSEDTGPTSCNLHRQDEDRHRRSADSRPRGARSATTARSSSAGPNVFLGYYKEPEATAETLQGRLAVLGRPRRVRQATASCRSPAARRRSSSPPAARTSRRRTSRR